MDVKPQAAHWRSWLRPFPQGSDAQLEVFRLICVAAQAGALAICWPLWQHHVNVPMLPVWQSIPDFSMGGVLIGTLVLVIFMPNVGCWLHAAALIFSVLQDQTREQPECFSLAILMLGTLPSAALRSIARWHLLALWFWAGFHKLVSPDYLRETSKLIFQELYGYDSIDAGVAQLLGAIMAAFEVGVAVLAVLPRTRRLATWAVAVMHLSIFIGTTRLLRVSLNLDHPVWPEWREPVFPWNLALIFSGFVFIRPWPHTLRQNLRASSLGTRVALVAVLASPALYYFGWLDAYLSNCLYSSNTPIAFIYRPLPDPQNAAQNAPEETSDNRLSIKSGQHLLVSAVVSIKLHASLPPAHRLLHAWYHQMAGPNDRLEIYDPRWWLSSDHLSCHVYHGDKLESAGERFELGAEPDRIAFNVVADGRWNYYFPDEGRLSHSGRFANGHEQGLWTYWNRQGEVEAEGQMQDGQQVGVWKYLFDGQSKKVMFEGGEMRVIE